MWIIVCMASITGSALAYGTTLFIFKPRNVIKNCGKMIGNKHIETAQRLPSGTKNDWGENFTKHKQTDLYKIPEKLIYDILEVCKCQKPQYINRIYIYIFHVVLCLCFFFQLDMFKNMVFVHGIPYIHTPIFFISIISSATEVSYLNYVAWASAFKVRQNGMEW